MVLYQTDSELGCRLIIWQWVLIANGHDPHTPSLKSIEDFLGVFFFV